MTERPANTSDSSERPDAAGSDDAQASATAERELAFAEPLGDFKLIREIGRGGMGVVYEAVQVSLGRSVAVKVLPFAAALDQRQLQRFRNEAQMAAQLHHTNIVPVYAVGCERSVHFYAMQLIDGQSLAEVIHELRRLVGRVSTADAPTVTLTQMTRPLHAEWSKRDDAADRPTPRRPAHHPLGVSTRGNAFTSNLSSLHSDRRGSYFRTVAQLGVQAAEALDHAHQAGVVHRDIKPANLLLDTRGNIWVTDFGLAQLYADNGLTQPGDMLGTFRYMSPEQAAGRNAVLDQRTDVYSLGLTLYELLTLERAVHGETRMQLLRHIESIDPVPARQLDRAIPPELEIILAKAVAKDPNERYQTAHEMADDLGRYLRDEPIRARPPTIGDKALKWVRRHRAISFAAVAVLVLSTIALLISTILIARAQNRTQEALVEEHTQRDRANRSAAMARDAVDYFTRVAAEELPRTPDVLPLKQEMLETSMRYYQAFLADRAGDVSMADSLNAARETVGQILDELIEVNENRRLEFGVRLLGQPSVQRALALNPAQIAEAAALQQKTLRPPSGESTTQPTSQEIRQALKVSNVELTAALDDLLTTAQHQRFAQISRQLRGVRAFDDPDVAQALSLSDEQKALVDRLERTIAVARRGPPRRTELPDDTARGKRDEMVRTVLNTFTPQQRTTWDGLVGEPFNGRLEPGIIESDNNRAPPTFGGGDGRPDAVRRQPPQ